jgi:hypothetical protein
VVLMDWTTQQRQPGTEAAVALSNEGGPLLGKGRFDRMSTVATHGDEAGLFACRCDQRMRRSRKRISRPAASCVLRIPRTRSHPWHIAA